MFFRPSDDLSLSEFKAKLELEGGVIVDCRTPMECANGILPNALQADWNAGEFADFAANLDKAKPVYCYCKSGMRSGAAVEYLKNQGFDSAFNLGGYDALKG
jgi:rhodanese-related sulfurtransferase